MNNLKTIKQFEVDHDDLYGILEVSQNASDVEIRRAYKKLAGTFHPDKKTGNEELFKAIKQAYDILIDPVKRSNYDATGIFEGADLEKVETARAAVETILATIINENEDCLECIDIFGHIKQGIEGDIKKCTRMVKLLNKKIERFNKLKKRAKDKLTAMTFEKIIQQHKENLEQVEKDKELYELSMKVVRGCVYEFDKKPTEELVW